jgi:hypothetical protein
MNANNGIGKALSSSSTGGATALTTDDFTMLPEETPGNPGLSFVPGLRLSANAGQTQHLVIGFRVSLLSVENPNIEDASLALSGVSIQPGGAIIDMEALCLEGGPTCVPLTVSANSMTTEPGFMASTSFPSVTSINVTETIDLTGQADLQVITKRFSEVAEPSTWLLVVSSLGLLMLWWATAASDRSKV